MDPIDQEAIGEQPLSSRERRKAKRRAERAAARAAQAVAGQDHADADDETSASAHAADEIFGSAHDDSDEGDESDEGEENEALPRAGKHAFEDAPRDASDEDADGATVEDVLDEFADAEIAYGPAATGHDDGDRLDEEFEVEPGAPPRKAPKSADSARRKSREHAASEVPAASSVYGSRPLPPGREDDQCFVVEGRRAVDAVIDGPLPIRALILIRQGEGQEDASGKFGDLEDRAVRRGTEVRRVDARKAKKYFETRHPQGVAALVVRPEAPDVEAIFAASRRILVLDGVSDPGNAGTLVRTAWLFGWDAVFATPGSVDLFGEKTVRASAGSIVHLPVARVSASLLASLAAANGFRICVGAPGSGSDPVPTDGKLVLVLGNEARGVESPWPNATPVGIAMRSGPVDSLGVVASGAILLNQLR